MLGNAEEMEFAFDDSLLLDWDFELSDDFSTTGIDQTDTQVASVVKKSRKEKPVKSCTSRNAKRSTSRKAPVVPTPAPLDDDVEFKFKLYSFPSFDKSDAMIYLPSTIARLTNSGAQAELKRLLRNHCAKNCEVIVTTQATYSLTLPLDRYTGLMEIARTMFPDYFSCMHTTKVEKNQIRAEMYFKYTDNPSMHTCAHTIQGIDSDPLFRMAFVGERRELLHRNLALANQPQRLVNKIMTLIDLEEEITVYGKDSLTLTFDPHTKKIMFFESVDTVLSVSHAGVLYSFTSEF